MTPKKCGTKDCYSDACCRDGKCAYHTTADRSLMSHGRRRYPSYMIPHLGVELECVARHQTALNAIKAQTTRPYYDGSLGGLGCEFKICKPVKQAFKAVPKFAAHLACIGATVDKSCGMHVHLDARGVPISRKLGFLAWLEMWESWWFDCIPPSRRTSSYVRSLSCSSVHNHYKWVNMTNYDTIEIRIHPGTLNPHKIKAWLCVCADLMDLLRSDKPFPTPMLCNHVLDLSKMEDVFVRTEGREYLLYRHACGGRLLSYVTSTASGPQTEGE